MTPANLVGQWRSKADDLLRAAKGYHCRSMEGIKTGLIKQAAQARMCADDLEKALAEAGIAEAKAADTAVQDQANQPEPAGRLIRTRTRRQALAASGGGGEDQGSVPLPEVRDGDCQG